MERNSKLIKLKFYQYLLPGVMMVAAMQLGNLVDSIFVGNLLGPDALSAINVGMPVVQLAQLPIVIFAVGGSIVSAICLGKRQIDSASAVFFLCMFGVLAFNLANAVAACFYSYPLADLLSHGGNLSHMAGDFIWVYLAGMPLIGIALMASYFMGVDSHPGLSALLHIVANVVNLISDYVFIAVFGLGMIGSALSTVVGYGLAGIVFTVAYSASPKRSLQVLPKRMGLGFGLVPSAAKNGLASGMIMLLGCVKMVVLNTAILTLAGEVGMALYAVCVNSFFLVQLCLHGVSGVIQTVAGVLYGEMDYFGIRVVLDKALKICLGVAALLTAVFLVTPDAIEVMFGFNLVDQKDQMDLCLRVFALSFGGYALNNVAQTYYSTIEKQLYATLNTVLQGLVILVPVTLALLPVVGVVGTSIGAVAAELGAFAIMSLVRKYRQMKGKEEGSRFDALPPRQNNRFVDITVKSRLHEAADLARALKEYCIQEGIGPRSANLVAVSGEELVREISVSNKGKSSYIDVCLVREGDALVLRVRDDGPLLNPLEADDAIDIENISELQVLKRLALRMEYSHVLNMNNTIVEISAKIDEDTFPQQTVHANLDNQGGAHGSR